MVGSALGVAAIVIPAKTRGSTGRSVPSVVSMGVGCQVNVSGVFTTAASVGVLRRVSAATSFFLRVK